MTWSTISCLVLSFASASLLMAAAPPRLRRAAAGGLSWVASVVIAAGLVLQLQSPATAHSAATPVVVMLAFGADGEELQPPLEVVPQAVTEAEALPAKSLAERSDELPPSAFDAPVELQAVPSTTESGTNESGTNESGTNESGTTEKRRVELPADFAAPDEAVIIPPRPEWVNRDPEMIDDNYYFPVSSALQVHQRNCKTSLDERLVEAVQEYIRDYLGSQNATYFIHYDIQEIRSRFVQTGPESQEFTDVVEVSFGQMHPMHQSHALLKFAAADRAELDAKWGEIRQTGRVVRTAGMAVGVLVVMSLMFGYFRLDTATKGYYTRRLQMVLGAAILAVVAGGILYYRSAAQLIYHLTM